MGSAWTTPITWTAGMVPGATEFNEQIRDNLNALKNPPFAATAYLPTADSYAWSSSGFTGINTAITLTVTTQGGTVFAYFQGEVTTVGAYWIDVEYDGTALGDAALGQGRNTPLPMMLPITGLASGSHTFRPIWRGDNANNIEMQSGRYIHFWVREG